MIKVRLNDEQRKALRVLRKARPNLAERAHYILLSDEGVPVKEISQRLNRHEHTIRTWIKAYTQRGVEGLENKLPPGPLKIKGAMVENEIEVLLIKPFISYS